MALATATITMDLADMLGTDLSKVRAWVDTNIANDTVVDTAGNKVRLGSGVVNVASDGTGTVSVWTPGTGSNPTTWQTILHVEYRDDAERRFKTRDFGPFTVTADADLADLIPEQEIPPAYLTTVTQQLDQKVAQGQLLLQQQQNLANISTPDALVKTLVTGPSQTATALLASTAQLKVWAKNPDNLVTGNLTYSSGLLVTADVVWPDGATGTLTIASRSAAGDVTGYTITRVVSGQPTTTYTQPTITRDSSGNVTTLPQITVA